MANMQDKEWLNLLGGKAVNAQEASQIKAALTLRSVIKKFNAEEIAQSEGLKKLNLRMAEEGLFLERNDINFSKKLIMIFKKIKLIIIFITGLVAGLMVPMQMATRGGDDSSFFSISNTQTKNVIFENKIKINDPGMTYLIIDSAVSSGLVVEVKQENKVKLITLKGLKKNDANQFAIKALLRLPNQRNGNVLIEIGGK